MVLSAWFFNSTLLMARSGSAPVVDAGPAKTIAFPAKDLTLFGHATDAENDPLTYQWSVTSGPAAVTFSASRGLATTATFSAAGVYTFQFAVNDGTNTSTSSTTVTVLDASTQTSFFVDPTYTGAVRDGSAAHPWTTLSVLSSNPAWAAINAALATNNVIVYFSARQAGSDTPEVSSGEVNLFRTDNSTNRLTMDGMSKYNTNDAAPQWADYTGANKFNIAVGVGSISIGVQSDAITFPMNYTTIRGFDVSGSSGRVGIAGNYVAMEYMHVHDVKVTGATVTVQLAVEQLVGGDVTSCTQRFGNLRDITFRNNLIERGIGEGIYIGGTYHLVSDGGCPSWGNTHSDILIEGNTIDHPGFNGDQGDGIDLKAGLLNVTVRNNVIHNMLAVSLDSCGITSEGIFTNLGVNGNYLFENNSIYAGISIGIKLSNQRGTIIRNNVIHDNATYGVSLTGPGVSPPENFNVEIYNNTIVNNAGTGVAIGYMSAAKLRNNIVFGNAAGKQVSTFTSSNISSDYNLYSATGSTGTGLIEGGNTQVLALATSLFVDPVNGDFHLLSNSPAVDTGVDLSATGFSTDISGTARPQGSAWDIGAYEFVLSSDTTPPSVSIITPINGATVAGPVTVTASASDNVAVVGVQFKLDGAILGAEVLTPPYSILWSTGGASNGTHTLTAVARDAGGNATTSAAVTVTVNNVADTIPPTVSVITPTNGTVVSGATTVRANASDNVGVAGVQFILDSAPLGGEVLLPPYSILWNTATAPNGPHMLAATARDAAGNVATSVGVVVTVNNVMTGPDTTPPTVSIMTPANGALVSGSTTVTANASDNVGVVGVQFRLDGNVLGSELTAPPYTVTWNTVASTNGAHTLTAVARDANGNFAQSVAVIVTVNNAAPTAAFKIPVNGGISLATAGDPNSSTISVSHGRMQQDTPAAISDPVVSIAKATSGVGLFSGVAMIGVRTNGVLATEAGVPASVELSSGRIYAEIGGGINTGIALSNLTATDATVSFYFTDLTGKDFGASSFKLLANNQVSAFLNQAPFNGPAGSGTPFLGSFTYSSTVPIGAIALRGLTNERSEFVFTTLPVAKVGVAPIGSTVPHFVDGAGWTTSVILTNMSDSIEAGNIQFFAPSSGTQNAPALTITVNGVSATTFSYSIPPHASARFDTSGLGSTVQVGSVRVKPLASSPFSSNDPPAAVGLLRFRMNGATVSQTTIGATPLDTGFRMYMEASGTYGAIGSIQSGIAIANPSSSAVTVSVSLTGLDGSALNLQAASLVIPPGGQVAKLLSELFPTLPASFQGIARLTAPSPVSVAALRGRFNERDEFLMTTTPPLNDAAGNIISLVFPHIVSGQGFSTQIVLFGTAASGRLYLLSNDGLLKPSVSLK
jgi:hypothetical protein